MKIAIFGSCVSRDTAEFIPDSVVVAYVARQSVTSLKSPHGSEDIDLSKLDSAFQKRMVTGDLKGNGVERIVKHADDLDLVLVDLVDERRGYWLFPDGSTMTNSLEVESCGAAKDAVRAGARLVEFGSDEHFAAWKNGFQRFIAELREAGLWERTVLLDIEWAAALAGAPHPHADVIARLARAWRRLRRSARAARRGLSTGHGIGQAWQSLRSVEPTEAEEYAKRAESTNSEYIRYRIESRTLTKSFVTKSSSEVRIDPNHKWGPQPFHYMEKDYRSFVKEILERLNNRL